MSKDRIIGAGDVSLYNMPTLEEDRNPKSKDEIMRDIEEIQRRAYEEGFNSGEKAGFADGEQKAAVLAARLETIIEEFAHFRENIVERLEEQVVDLAIAMAKKIIIDEINERPEVIVMLVKEALKRLQRIGTITIKINTALYDLFMKKKAELIDIHEDIIFDVNSNVSMTGPLVISETEEVVTDIEALISNIVDDINMVQAQKTGSKTNSMDTTNQTVDNGTDHLPDRDEA